MADAPGCGRLQIVDDQSWSKLEQYGEHPFTERVIEVDLVAIDELVRGGRVPPPTVVKIDVEGAELAVLAGMRETIAAHRPAIICELHDTHAEFVAAMGACGYRVINLEGTIPMRDAGASAHALALPRSTLVTEGTRTAGMGLTGRRGSGRLQAGPREQLAVVGDHRADPEGVERQQPLGVVHRPHVELAAGAAHRAAPARASPRPSGP